MKPKATCSTKGVKPTKVGPLPRAVSPFSGKTADYPIAHLERVLLVSGAMNVFGPNYWRMRVAEIAASPALTPVQRARIARINDLIERLVLRGNEADLACKAA
ncbi:hypothetical protein ABH945_002158 [Paraburkholderia sp. GAS333]|uniref:hypothetical protein n=1 Tax=Paraburkholderia sp. GAS333 TaxID=3156279 RepID=UPI003D22309C